MAVTYRQAGVDIEAGDALVERIKPLARATRTAEVLDDVGGFAGLCGLPGDIDDPVLVSGTDGVGTKLKVAVATGRHDTIGQDLVAMCVNDVVTTGARPLFFLDYVSCEKLDVDTVHAVVRGIADGCKLAGCALLGGETAEHPGMHHGGHYDLAGFSVGVVSRSAILGPERVRAGDEVIAVASSGLHSNGYSLALRVLHDGLGLANDRYVPELGACLGDVLLTPTRIYARACADLGRALGRDLHALCHITGGGIVGNLPRVLPHGTDARIRLNHERPAIFGLIQRGGPVEEEEMRRVFNLGIGLVAVVAAQSGDRAVETLRNAGERAWHLGKIELAGQGGAPVVHVEP